MSKKFFFAGFLVVIFSLVLFTTTWAAYGLEETARTAGLNTGLKLPTLIGNVIGTALSLIGVIFFALMIFGGFLWMTAHGKEEQAKQGMDTVIAAVIGLIIILAAYAITNFVFSSVGGTATTGGGGGNAGGGGSGTIADEQCCDNACTSMDVEVFQAFYSDFDGCVSQCLLGVSNSDILSNDEKTYFSSCLGGGETEPTAPLESNINASCDSNADCIDSICKKGTCQKGASCPEGLPSTSLIGCTGLICTNGDKCSAHSQCQSGHCVNGYCESGLECAECTLNSDCESNFYCFNGSSRRSCLPKNE